jgi:predicted  nucleic acid-binding Zn-ribbon protein
MQRNSEVVATPNIECYYCGHRYDHLGPEPHPGVCPECGERAVDFAGDVSVVSVEPLSFTSQLARSSGGETITSPTGRPVNACALESESPDTKAKISTDAESDTSRKHVRVRLSDATDRRLEYVALVGPERSTLLIVRVGMVRLTPMAEYWGSRLLPPTAVSELASHPDITAPVELHGEGPVAVHPNPTRPNLGAVRPSRWDHRRGRS